MCRRVIGGNEGIDLGRVQDKQVGFKIDTTGQEEEMKVRK